MRVSGGNGILASRAGSSGFPAQLVPRWNVYGREVDDVVKRRARGVLQAIRLANAGVYNLKVEGRYLQGGTSILVVCSKFNSPFTASTIHLIPRDRTCRVIRTITVRHILLTIRQMHSRIKRAAYMTGMMDRYFD